MLVCVCDVLGCRTYEALNAVGVIKFVEHAYSRVSMYTAETCRYLSTCYSSKHLLFCDLLVSVIHHDMSTLSQ